MNFLSPRGDIKKQQARHCQREELVLKRYERVGTDRTGKRERARGKEEGRWVETRRLKGKGCLGEYFDHVKQSET